MNQIKFSMIKMIFVLLLFSQFLQASQNNRIAYLVSDIRIPFWEIMSRGMKAEAKSLGYELEIYSADNIKKIELENTIKAIKSNVAGIIISPISSSTGTTILRLAKQANIPVVISDIGAQSQDYVSFISSNNFKGAYGLGKVLVKKMQEHHWHDGTVGIIAIPQKRANGKARTNGFMKALGEGNINGADIQQQSTFSCSETYDYAITMIKKYPKMRALWLQGSDRYKAALNAIKDSGKEGEILLICFDAEPEFLDMIPKGILVAAAMQQPYLMGKKALEVLDTHLQGKRVTKNIEMDILVIDKENITQNRSLIEKYVLGIKDK